MANVFVWSGATSTADGLTWATAYKTFELAVVGKLAGDIFFVAHDHAQSSAVALTITFPGTAGAPNKVYCVNRLGSVPPIWIDIRTTATVTTTGTSDLKLIGYVDFYGIIFSCGTGTGETNFYASSAAGNVQKFTKCSLRIGSSHTDSAILAPDWTSGTCIFEDTTVQFGMNDPSYQSVYVSGILIWRNTATAILGSLIPTYVFDINSVGAKLIIEGVDLSAIASPRYLVYPRGISNVEVYVKNCKMGTGIWGMYINTLLNGCDYQFINCDTGGNAYRSERANSGGVLQTETAIVRTGGASDGVIPISWKITPAAYTRWEFPFECFPLTVWNDTVGVQKTLYIYGSTNATAPTTEDVWIDVEYMGTVGSTKATLATSTKANGLIAGTTYSSSGGAWSGGVARSFAMAASFTPQVKGMITVYVRVGKASTVYYIDPKPVLI